MINGFCDHGPTPNPGTEEMSYHEIPSDYASRFASHELGSIRSTNTYDQVGLAIYCIMKVVHVGMIMSRIKRFSGSSRAL